MKKIKRFKRINWKAIVVAILVTGLAWLAWSYLSSRTNQARTLQLLESKQVELNKELKELDSLKTKDAATEKARQELETQNADITKQLETKRAQQAADKVYAETLSANAVHVAQAACSDPKSCIYFHESRNDPTAVNGGGCRGLGQACPGSKLPCGDDYACQDAWFTDYMLNRYHTWANAWAFWQSQCGTPKGCWW